MQQNIGMTDVLTFAQRPRRGQPRRGVVRSVDVDTSCVRLEFSDDGRESVARLQAHECTDCLRDFVAHASDALVLTCDVAFDEVVELNLTVLDVDALDAALDSGTYAAEESLVHLLRSVWRDARVKGRAWPSAEANGDTGCAEDDREAPGGLSWKHPLREHQARTVAWMRSLEARAPLSLPYAGNLRLTGRWFVDTEGECVTDAPSWREAQLSGGICADGMGTGKSANVLRLVFEGLRDRRPPAAGRWKYASRTLLILPLNLVAQWHKEVDRFVGGGLRVLWLVHARDVRAVDMSDVCDADMVVTTFHLLRGKGYSEVVEHALGNRVRSRAGLTAWARQSGRTEPVLEAIHWGRVVVDELHQTFESPRDQRHLKLFSRDFVWGLSATPIVDCERELALYLLLARDKAHHPNLLAAIAAEGVKSHTDSPEVLSPIVQLVHLSAEERMHLRGCERQLPTKREERLRAVVRLCSFVVDDDSPGGQEAREDGHESTAFDVRFRRAQQRLLDSLRAKAEAHARAVKVLERTSEEFDRELTCCCKDGERSDEAMQAHFEVVRAASESNARDLQRARDRCASAWEHVNRLESWNRMVTERVTDKCVVCGVRKCEVIAPCAHVFCTSCLGRLERVCPQCGDSIDPGDVIPVGSSEGFGTKMGTMRDTLLSFSEETPVLLFVQWKTMMRSIRAFLKGSGVRVLTLDGNTSQRASTLSDFEQGGTLLLCLEDSFAGLHLPHARHVIFAHALVGNADRVRALERQAIARCIRPGQTHAVSIRSFVVANTDEEDLWKDTRDPG